jgi:pantetheine-phosphate adenylyltransferase
MSRVLYPGSFDPIHLGHLDVVSQAAELFGSVVVTVLHNPEKPTGMFGADERVAMAETAMAGIDNVTVVARSGLAVDAARELGADFIVKGLRSGTDFDVEQQMANTNHVVAGVRTVYLPCAPEYGYISSRFIREIAQMGGDASAMVPGPVASALAGRFPTRRR